MFPKSVGLNNIPKKKKKSNESQIENHRLVSRKNIKKTFIRKRKKK